MSKHALSIQTFDQNRNQKNITTTKKRCREAVSHSAHNRKFTGSKPVNAITSQNTKSPKHNKQNQALVLKWYHRSLPRSWPGFDSRLTHHQIFFFFLGPFFGRSFSLIDGECLSHSHPSLLINVNLITFLEMWYFIMELL